MHPTTLIISKELNSYFSSWGLYAGLATFYMVTGFYCWFSTDNLFTIGQASLSPFFYIASLCIIVLCPVLSMKSINEELRQGTLELLLTKPIKTTQLLHGKFFAQLILTIMALVLTLPFYLTIAFLGNIDHGATILGYLSLVNIASCCIAIGLFTSSICRSATAAFSLSMMIELAFFALFPALADIISIGFWADLFGYLSFTEHTEALTTGVLDSRDMFFVSWMCIMFLTLARYYICKSRY